MTLAVLTSVDWGIIVVYLAAAVAVGLLNRGKQDNAEDYFTTSGTMGSAFYSILVGLSVAASFFSGISFLAFPSLTYSGGAVVIVEILAFPIMWLFLKVWFLPRYLANNDRHPYAIIERRFGKNIRTMTAAMYILLRVGWMAVLIYAPTVAIIGAAQLSQDWFWPIILTVGLCSTFYATLGGIRGVIFTDAIQFTVVLIGILTTFILILYRLPVDFSQAAQYLLDTGRLNLDFSLDPKKVMTFWAMLIGMDVSFMCVLMSDQMSLQRYLAVGNSKAASRSIAFNLLGVAMVITILIGVGLALAVWYHFCPDPNMPAQIDRIFPFFIATVLPTGVSGLLLAALLSATMSAMTGGINILSAVITLDFRGRFGSPMTPKQQLRFARYTCLAIGLAATLIAGLVDRLGTIFDQAQILLGLFSGPIFVAVFLAVAKSRTHVPSLAAGMILSVIVGAVTNALGWASVWVCTVTCLIAWGIALAGSMIFKNNQISNSNDKDSN